MAISQREPIAVVGVGCRFPGSCDSLSKLWDMLQKPGDLSRPIPSDRFNVDRYYHNSASHHGTSNVKRSYLLSEDVAHFDHGFFAIPPGEAEAIDPQQRMLLEVTYEAIDSAGMTLEQLNGSDTALYVGMMNNDYLVQQALDPDFLPKYNSTGVANSNASSRISYFFDWHGPSMTLDTACSSSAVAVYEAVQTLRNGTSRVAVAAGTNLLLAPLAYISASNLSMLSPTGYSRMWDADADGYARGEGVAVVVLKTLSAALQDGDEIHSVIREVGLNHDGKTTGLTMPSAAAQASLIQRVYRQAGLDPLDKNDRCQFFEAHGTGTPAGDPQEAEALSRAFFNGEPDLDQDNRLFVGSIKTVMGHTESTAGLAGLLKATLAVKHGLIPPNLLFNKLNPRLEPFTTNLRVPTEAQPWPLLAKEGPRRASVNSFGFGGANAHMIIESYTPGPRVPRCLLTFPPSPPGSRSESSNERGAALRDSKCRVPIIPFVFSAGTAPSLKSTLQSFVGYLGDHDTIDLRSLADGLTRNKSALQHRIAFAASSQEALLTGIREKLERAENNNESIGAPAPSASCLLGVFTGQGAQWAAMGTRLVSSIPMAQSIMEELDASLSALPEEDRPRWSLMRELLATNASRIHQAEISQPLCTAVQLVLVDLLRGANIRLGAVIGHSSGEIAAAYAAGFLSKSDAIRVSYYRGLYAKLASKAGAQGGMLAVGTSYEDAQALCDLEDFAGRIVVAAVNSPESLTLSGDIDAINQAKVIFDEEKKFARLLKVDTAYHSHHMTPCADVYFQALRLCEIEVQEPHANAPKWFSSVHDGQLVQVTEDTCEQLAGQYWVDNMVKPVLFARAAQEAWQHEGLKFTFGVEVGPHPALQSPFLDSIKAVGGSDLPYSGTLRRGQDDIISFTQFLGAVWSQAGRGAVDLTSFSKKAQRATKRKQSLGATVPQLPRYPWNHDRRLWCETRAYKHNRSHETPVHDLLGTLTADSTIDQWRWRNVLSTKELPWMIGHALQGQVVFPATGYIALAMEAAMEIAKPRSVRLIELQDLDILRAISIIETSSTELAVHMSTAFADAGRDDLTAEFTVYSALANKESMPLILNCRGFVRITFELENDQGTPTTSPLPGREIEAVNMAPVDVEDFYSTLRTGAGYSYEAPFKNITRLSRRMGLATGSIEVPSYEEGSNHFLFHPAVADCALQGVFATYMAPGDGSLTKIHVPRRCNKISLVPSLCKTGMTETVDFDCSLDTGSQRPGTTAMAGDIEIYSRGYANKLIQIEGLEFVPFSAATKDDDKLLYQESTWCPDQPDHALLTGKRDPTAAERKKAMDAERAALFYMQRLRSSVKPEDRDILPWYRKAMLDSVDQVVRTVLDGTHAYACDWKNDTQEEIEAMMKNYGDDADFNLTRAVGENLLRPEVLSSEVNILEFMTQNDNLGRYYREAQGFQGLNDSLGGFAQQLTNKYPHMHICEVGAGTGGATKAILDVIGDAFASYTYTDISSGFFESAQDRFRPQAHKMTFKTLNVEKDPADQGFAEHSYDCVVAANVLHATKFLDTTLKNVRRLLKPGGYLVLFEIIGNNVMRIPLVMGGLPGWWIGYEDGRRLGPTIELEEWDAVLKRAGFTGIDTCTPMIDPVSLPGSIACAMATDEKIEKLRRPLALESVPEPAESEILVMITGKTNIGEKLGTLLKERYRKIIAVAAVKDLPDVPSNAHVLCLEDYGASSYFENVSDESWQNLQRLMESPQTALWVMTEGGSSKGMSRGLLRNLYHEMPDSLVQVLDCDDEHDEANVERIAELMLRLRILSSKKEDDQLLWALEPELRLRRGKLEVCRVRLQDDQNARLNSAKRPITRSINVRTDAAMLVPTEESYVLRPCRNASKEATSNLDEHVTVQVSSSFLLALKTTVGYGFVLLGSCEETGKRVLCLSPTNSSRVTLHKSWTYAVGVDAIDRQYLSLAIGAFLNNQVLKQIPSTGSLLLHDPDPALASLLAKQMRVQGRTATFVSSRPDTHLQRGRWIYLHEHCTTRAVAAAIPKDTSVYLHAPYDTLDPGSLAARLAAAVPPHCHKMDLGSFVSKEASALPETAPQAVVDLLHRVTSFARGQLNGVPDGVTIMDMLPLRHILSSPLSSSGVLVDWTASARLPVRVEPVSSRTDLFRSDKTYWLVGIANDLGRSLADFLIAHGARHVALSSRRPVPSIEWVDWHQRVHGARVEYFSVDVIDQNSVEAAHCQILASMPAIVGVALGALVLCDRLFAKMTLPEFQRVTQPKIEGTINVDRLFPEDTLDWFIGLSSIVATMGNPGQANYAAANCGQKAIISKRRARGLAGSVIDISRVVGVGYVEREMKKDGRITKEQKERLFTGSMTLPTSEMDLHQLFVEAINAGRGSSNMELITGMAPVRKEKAHPNSWPRNPKFGLLVRVGEDQAAQVGENASQEIPVGKLLEDAKSPEDKVKIIKECLAAKLRLTLFLSASDTLPETSPLIDIGVDSLVGVEIRTWCMKQLGVDLPVMKILGGISFAEIVDEIVQGLEGKREEKEAVADVEDETKAEQEIN